MKFKIKSSLLIYLAVKRLTPHTTFKESQDLTPNSNQNACDQYTFQSKQKN